MRGLYRLVAAAALVVVSAPMLVITASGAPASTVAGAAGVAADSHTLTIHGRGKVFDVRELPQVAAADAQHLHRDPPDEEPDAPDRNPNGDPYVPGPVVVPDPADPAPNPTNSFEGLHFNQDCNGTQCGTGHPPDTNGDVGPTYYIQTVNAAIGIYTKASGNLVAAFSFDQFMSQGTFGNVCDTENFGDPVVLYDSFEDRWFISDFAFMLDGSGNVVNPPGAFECMAVSKTGDPVAGGWNFYSINTAGGLGDYPKFGIWPDGIYMSTNMFSYASAYQNPRVYAFDKAQMYAGAPSVQAVTFDAPSDDFTLLPSNARLQSGTPPAGTPNYFVSTWRFLNAITVYKFHVDWAHPTLSTFTGPDTPTSATSWPNANVPFAPTPGNANDVLQIRAMMQNQYSNIGGVESLWDVHTVRRGDIAGNAAPRYYQTNVTGGTVAANLVQAATWDPEGANTNWRYTPSLAVDRAGDMALGYTLSNATTNPSIRYAGRLATDPVNTFSQTEQVLINGTGAQTGICGSGTCTRWGDYSAMSLDPDGCTFWYTNEYYVANGLDDHTRIGSFSYPSCTPVGAGGTVSGTVTAAVGGAPIAGATVSLGSRSATTAGDGTYAFSVPAGTYPSLTTAAAGYTSVSTSGVGVTDGNTTTRDFALVAAASSGNFVDTTQLDFQGGTGTYVDLTTSAGNVVLTAPQVVDQQNQIVTTSGFGFNSTAWAGQTFKAGASGQLTRVDLDLFCSSCTGTTPNLTVSIRATTGAPALPTGADLATATIAGFSSGSGGFFAANFASPLTVTPGTTYAILVRAVTNPSAGTYAYVVSSTNPYANGQRVTSANSGSTWTADVTSGGRDLGFVTYVFSGFAPSGSLVSSLKDANPSAGQTPHWGALSWTASTPAGTAVTFQAAASSSPYGPFSFVGPDGTSGTSFSNGGSLTQFDGTRYLKYRATLSTSSGSVTPTLSDVTIGFNDVGAPTITGFSPAGATQGKTITVLGSGFTGATAVAFAKAGGGTVNASTFSVTDDAHLSVKVPPLATTGTVSVTTPGGTGVSAVNLLVKPKLKSFVPASGPVGALVTLKGSAFTGATKVTFNGTSASFSFVSDTTIKATVPAGATTGIVQVTTAGGKAKSKTAFTVT